MQDRKARFVRRLLKWGRANPRSFPWRDPGRTPYEVLVAELLLKRTTSKAAARAYPIFLNRFPSFSAIAEAREPYLASVLQPVGLSKQRAKGFREMAKHVEKVHHGTLPSRIAALEQLPHTGPYSARAVASFAYNQRAAIVDSNVIRVLSRVFAKSVPERQSLKAWQALADCLVPNREHRLYNYALLDLGATVCRYDRPHCSECPLAVICDSAKP